MSRLAILVALGLAVVACTKQEPPPKPEPTLIMPGSRLLWSNGSEVFWVVCDQGNRIIMSNRGSVTAIPQSCPDGKP
jgi:hypothetical protein